MLDLRTILTMRLWGQLVSNDAHKISRIRREKERERISTGLIQLAQQLTPMRQQVLLSELAPIPAPQRNSRRPNGQYEFRRAY